MSRVGTARDLPQGGLTSRDFAERLSASLDLVWLVALYLTADVIQPELLVERVAGLAWERRAALPQGEQFTLGLLALLVETWRREFFPSAADPWVEASVGDAYEMTRKAGHAVDADPAAELAAGLGREEVCRAFAQLAPEERAVTALSLAADLSYSDLGLIVGAPRDLVRARLQRGRAALKVALWQGSGRSKK